MLPAVVLPAKFRVCFEKDGGRTYLDPGDNNFLGNNFQPGDQLRIELIPRGNFFVVKEDRDKNLGVIKGRNTEEGENIYVKGVHIHSTRTGQPSTKWPGNHAKIIYLDRNDKNGYEFRLWEVGIVTQCRENVSSFFLTEQLVYQSQMFRDEHGRITMPGFTNFKDWPQIQDHVDLMIEPSSLPVISGVNIKPERSIKLRNGTGQVIWYSLAYQVGAIMTAEGPVRCHWSEINSDDRFRFLKEGQKVKFNKLVEAVNSYRWPRITNFKFDAVGITPF